MKLQQQYQQLITVFSSKSLLQFSANIGWLFGEAKFSYFGNPFREVFSVRKKTTHFKALIRKGQRQGFRSI